VASNFDPGISYVGLEVMQGFRVCAQSCTGLVLNDLPMDQGEPVKEIGNDDRVALRLVCLFAGGRRRQCPGETIPSLLQLC